MPICVDSLPADMSFNVLAFGASVRVSINSHDSSMTTVLLVVQQTVYQYSAETIYLLKGNKKLGMLLMSK